MASTGSILVTPENLISASQEFSDIGNTVNSLTQQMLQIVRAMNSVWSGESSTAYGTKFNSLENDMTRIHKMITEHATDLQEMARNYQEGESANVETSGGLPSDIIS